MSTDCVATLAETLAPLAPHTAEALLLALGREDGPELLGPWPSPGLVSLPT